MEYEINNIANSAEIKVDLTTFVLLNMSNFEELYKKINELKKRKLQEKIKKFLGVKVREKEKITEQIFSELNESELNKSKLSMKIKNLIKEKQSQEIKEKSIENFSNELFEIKTSNEFWVYAHNISYTDKKQEKCLYLCLNVKLKKVE